VKHAYSKIMIMTIVGLIWTGCEKNPASSENSQVNLELNSIYPGNGASHVEKSAAILIEFNHPVDQESCESRTGLYMGELYQIPTMGMGMMMGGLTGQFHWNDSSTVMTFYPDSMLMDSEIYSICIQEGMLQTGSGGAMMMGGMNAYGMETTGGIISHFNTH